MTPYAKLGEFLLARIAEDEAVARAASQHPVPADADAVRVVWYRHDTGWVPSAQGEWADGQALLESFDPARILAECEAKRRIVDVTFATEEGEDVLRLLSALYSEHPEYNPAWRP